MFLTILTILITRINISPPNSSTMKRIVTFDAAYSLKFANQYSIAKYIYYFGKKNQFQCAIHTCTAYFIRQKLPFLKV